MCKRGRITVSPDSRWSILPSKQKKNGKSRFSIYQEVPCSSAAVQIDHLKQTVAHRTVDHLKQGELIGLSEHSISKNKAEDNVVDKQLAHLTNQQRILK